MNRLEKKVFVMAGMSWKRSKFFGLGRFKAKDVPNIAQDFSERTSKAIGSEVNLHVSIKSKCSRGGFIGGFLDLFLGAKWKEVRKNPHEVTDDEVRSSDASMIATDRSGNVVGKGSLDSSLAQFGLNEREHSSQGAYYDDSDLDDSCVKKEDHFLQEQQNPDVPKKFFSSGEQDGHHIFPLKENSKPVGFSSESFFNFIQKTPLSLSRIFMPASFQIVGGKSLARSKEFFLSSVFRKKTMQNIFRNVLDDGVYSFQLAI